MADGNAPRGWMDSECVDLCNALNSIKGIETSESCCGHNYETYKIFFLCFDLKALRFIQACIDSRYWKYGSEWSIRTYISDSGPELLNFILESKSSDLNEIMVQVKDMIDSFNYYLNHEGRFKFLGLDHENFIFEEVEEIPFEY
jgi:hypothetical protein